MDKTVIRSFTIADFEEEEIWLREKHKSGWKLKKMIPPCEYIFESCEPKDVIYRLDYTNAEKTNDYLQMYKDFGWEYFTECAGWMYFRKPAEKVDSEADGELFSDNTSRSDMVRKIVKTRFLPLTVIFLCCIVPNLFFIIRNGNSISGILAYFIGGVFSILFVINLVLLIHCSIKLIKIINKYRD